MKEEDKYCCHYLVAFIDLLGQKEELLKLKKLPDKENKEELQHFEEQFKKTYGRAKTLYNAIDGFLKNLYDPAKRPFSSILFTNEVKYKRFADGIAIHLPLMDKGDNIPLEGVNGILLACASAIISFLEQGIPLRGGIDVDLGFEIDEDDVYGPSVVKAYTLENKIAQYPRIVVGEGLIDYLNYASLINGQDYREKLNQQMAEKSLDLIVRDTDGYHIIDYMGPGFQEATNHVLEFQVFLNIYKHVKEEQIKWKEKKDSKLAFRYMLMLNYIESRLALMKKARDGK